MIVTNNRCIHNRYYFAPQESYGNTARVIKPLVLSKSINKNDSRHPICKIIAGGLKIRIEFKGTKGTAKQ